MKRHPAPEGRVPGRHGGERYGAAEMAVICAVVRNDSEPMPPLLVLIALWIELTDEPFFPLPWQPAQYWV